MVYEMLESLVIGMIVWSAFYHCTIAGLHESSHSEPTARTCINLSGRAPSTADAFLVAALLGLATVGLKTVASSYLETLQGDCHLFGALGILPLAVLCPIAFNSSCALCCGLVSLGFKCASLEVHTRQAQSHVVAGCHSECIPVLPSI